MPKLTKSELTLKRIATRIALPSPAWGDHVLKGVQGRTTAGNLTRLTQSLAKAVK